MVENILDQTRDDPSAQNPALDDNPTGSQDGAQDAPEWLQAIEDQNLQNDPTLRRFKSPQALAVSYNDLRRKLGENPIVRPAENDPKEKWDAYYKALGRPDTPDDYKFTPAGEIDADSEALGDYRRISHEIGLTQDQADRLNLWVTELAGQAQKEQDQAAAAEAEETAKTLKAEWGVKYDDQVALARKALKYHGGEGVEKALRDTGLLNNADIIRFFNKLGQQTSEDQLKGVGDGSGRGQARYTRSQLERMMSDPRYRDPTKRDPAFVAEIERGFKALYPGQSIAAPTERSESAIS